MKVTEARVGKTLITKAGENTTGLGVIDVEAARSGRRWVIEKSGRRWPVDPARAAADPKVETAPAPYAKEAAPFDQVIGETTVDLDLRREDPSKPRWKEESSRREKTISSLHDTPNASPFLDLKRHLRKLRSLVRRRP